MFPMLTFLCASNILAQVAVLVESGNGALPVVGMNGQNVIVSDDGGRREVYQSTVLLTEAAFYTDGGIMILDKKVGVGASFEGVDSRFTFRFRAMIRAERDFEDCFALFIVESKEGDRFKKIVDLNDVDQGDQLIDVSFSTVENIGDFRYGYFFFSAGEEIKVDDSIRNKAIAANREKNVSKSESAASKKPKIFRHTTNRKSSLDATAAHVWEQQIPKYPESLRGSNVNGIAEVLYTMDERGEVVEILDMKADHPAFLHAAREAVLKSRYKPSVYEGKPLVTTMEQVFAFDEFVCFAEGAEIVPYPNVENREPLVVYGPNRLQLVEQLKKVAGKQFVVEVEINELGQVVSASAKSVDGDVVDHVFDDAFSNWVFLPSLDQGIAYSKRVHLQLAERKR